MGPGIAGPLRYGWFNQALTCFHGNPGPIAAVSDSLLCLISAMEQLFLINRNLAYSTLQQRALWIALAPIALLQLVVAAHQF